MINNNKNPDISNILNNYFNNNQWNESKQLLEIELSKDPDDYWLITNLAIVYYELKEYETAFSFSERAMKINPKDYLVLDYHACILSVMEGHEKAAIKLLIKIINTDLNKIAYSPNGEGMSWAKSIVNDCRVRLALVYKSIDKKKDAFQLLNEHLKHRQRGVFSNFTKRNVLKILSSLGGTNE